MGAYLNSFLQSLAQSNQFQLQQQAAARQQQELELQQQKEKNAQQLGLIGALQEGARINGPAGGAPPAPTTGSAFGGVDVGMPGSEGSDPGRSVDFAGQQLSIPGPQEQAQMQTSAAVNRAKALYPIGKVPLTEQGSEALGGVVPPGTPFDPSHLAGIGALARAYAMNNKTEAQGNQAPRLVGHSITADDQGNQTEIKTFSDGSTQEAPLKARGKTSALSPDRSMTPNEAAGHKQQAIEDYRRALSTESDLNTQRLRLSAALSSGQHYIAANGALKPFSGQSDAEIQGMQEDMRARYEQATNQLASVYAQKNDAITRAGGHPAVSTDQAIANLQASHAHNMNRAFNPGGGGAAVNPQTQGQPQPTAQPQQPASVNGQAGSQPGAVPTAAPGGRPAPNVTSVPPPNAASASGTAAGAKTATLDDVGAYAAAHGIGRAEVIRRFIAKGYKINANGSGR